MKWIVVGAGSAGCVVARRLVDAGHSVTIIEAGPPLRPGAVPRSIDGDDSFAALGAPGRVYPGLLARRTADGDREHYPRGRGEGGSSAVNSMVALRGDRELYESWGWFDTGDMFERVEVPIERPDDDEIGPVTRALLDADQRAEIAGLTRRNGRRITAAEAYLWPVQHRLTTVTERLVDRIDFDDRGTAVGVVFENGERLDGDAVAVCAGAIHTPTIMLRSGVETAGVGTGLQDHPAVALALRLRHRGDAGGQFGLSTAGFLDADSVQILPMDHLGAEAAPDLGLLLVALMRPLGATGTVRLASDDPRNDPIVDFDLLRDERDLDALCDGVDEALRLVRSAPFEEAVADVFIDDSGTPMSALDDRSAIAAWVRRRSADYVHASSSMSRALGAFGVVRGRENLFVADASAFPSIPNVNTYLPTMMLAERFVHRWIEGPGSST